MEEKAEHYEVLARFQSPVELYGAKIGQWFYILGNQSSLDYLVYWHKMYQTSNPSEFTKLCRNEFKYNGVARGKTALNAWRNACQNLINLKHE
jgi:hypothetical protein